MTTLGDESSDAWAEIPAPHRAALREALGPGESVLASLVTDLDRDLRFSEGLVVLTDRRLMEPDPSGGWRSWTSIAARGGCWCWPMGRGGSASGSRGWASRIRR